MESIEEITVPTGKQVQDIPHQTDLEAKGVFIPDPGCKGVTPEYIRKDGTRTNYYSYYSKG